MSESSSVLMKLRHRVWDGPEFEAGVVDYTVSAIIEATYDEMVDIFGEEPLIQKNVNGYITCSVRFDDDVHIRIIGRDSETMWRVKATGPMGVERFETLLDMSRSGALRKKIEMCGDEDLAWVPAEGGLAKAFTKNNVTYRRMWNPLTDERRLFNITDGVFVEEPTEVLSKKLINIFSKQWS